jgi:hypothetical protein
LGRVGQYPAQQNRNDQICFNPYLYRARISVERSISRIKLRPRVGIPGDRIGIDHFTLNGVTALYYIWDNASSTPAPRVSDRGRRSSHSLPTLSAHTFSDEFGSRENSIACDPVSIGVGGAWRAYRNALAAHKQQDETGKQEDRP